VLACFFADPDVRGLNTTPIDFTVLIWKTKTQQKTNDKDGDQASGGKPKEQSSVNKNSGAVIYQVGTDNIITEATQHLSNRLKLKHGEDNVVVVTKNKKGLLKIQGDTNNCSFGLPPDA
jgi:hypothetical protein